MTLPEPWDRTAQRVREQLERQLLCAVGWTGPLRRIDIDPELIADLIRRRIHTLIVDHLDVHGGTCWSAVKDELIEAAIAGDRLAHDALTEHAEVITADGWPHAEHAIVARLEAAADRERRFAEAVAEVNKSGFRVVPAEEVGA